MIRQAATFLTRRWNPSHLGAASQRYNGGVQVRLLAASSKAKAPPPPPSARPAPAASAPKDDAQEAIDKSERLHSELRELPISWLTVRKEDFFPVRIDGRGSPWFNNLIQLRHSSSSARGGGGRNQDQDYTQVGGPIDASACGLSESKIHNLLSTRNHFRRKRDFERADSILEQIRRYGIEVDDKAKTWRADGKSFGSMPDCQTIGEAIKVLHDNLENASPRNISAFWAVVPKLLNSQRGRKQKQPLVPQLSEIFDKTAGGLGSYEPRDLVTTALAFAKIIKSLEKGRGKKGTHEEFLHSILEGRKKEIFQFIGKSAIPILSQFDTRDISNLAYACALSRVVPEFEDGSTLFHHIAESSIPLVRAFSPQGISNMICSFEKSKVLHHLMFERMADHIVGLDNLGAFKSQDLANIVWAFVKADTSHPLLFEKIADHIASLDDLGGFKPQNLANTIWAFTTAGVLHPPLLERVADHITSLDNLGGYKPQNISNIVWGFEKAEITHQSMFDMIANHIAALDHLGAFQPQALANIVWTFTKADATARVSQSSFFERVADHIAALNHLSALKPLELANIVWAFAKAEISHPGLFGKIADHIVSLDSLGAFNQQEISNLTWGFAKADVKNPELFDKLADAADKGN